MSITRYVLKDNPAGCEFMIYAIDLPGVGAMLSCYFLEEHESKIAWFGSPEEAKQEVLDFLGKSDWETQGPY